MLINFRNWAICVQGCDPREKENKQNELYDHLVFLPQAVSQFWQRRRVQSLVLSSGWGARGWSSEEGWIRQQSIGEKELQNSAQGSQRLSWIICSCSMKLHESRESTAVGWRTITGNGQLNYPQSLHRAGCHSHIHHLEWTDLVEYIGHSVETLNASHLSTGAKWAFE